MDTPSYIANTFFTSEYKKASISTLITESIRLIISFPLYKYFNESRTMQYLFFMNVILIWLHYTLDIFLVKSFTKSSRLSWYTHSFINFNFVKYLIASTIYYITSETIVTYISRILNRNNIKHKYRDIVLRLVVNAISFGLYMYDLKFKWAYIDKTNPVINMIVMSWSSILIILYMIFKSVNVRQ